MMQIHYPRNHFVSVVEKGDAATVKGGSDMAGTTI